MQSVQRRFGKFLPRTADESQVAVLLKDFEDTDKMLAKIIDAAKAWRDSWRDILTTQQRLTQNYQNLYAPILGASEDYVGHVAVETDPAVLSRTEDLQTAYEGLKTDLMEEIDSVDVKIVKPAQEARDFIAPLKKVIKKREDRKLDYEKYQHRVDNARKKPKRSDKDNATLEKSEQDLTRTKEEYQWADEHLRSHLPAVITSAFSLLPHLLSAQIMIQNSLLAHYYTLLHDYCAQEGFQDPPPTATEIISDWTLSFKSVQQQVESFGCIAGGKSIRQQMRTDSSGPGAGRNTYNNQRRPSGNALKPITSPNPPAAIEAPPTRPKPSPVPSQTSLSLSTPNYASGATSPSDPAIHAPAGPRADYFTRDRLPSNSSMASIAAAKKKPPPPPPPKKVLADQACYVTALYDFDGQGQGDLAFREGDRIRVVKRTDSTDDWWEGDLRGVQGAFPANYVQVV